MSAIQRYAYALIQGQDQGTGGPKVVKMADIKSLFSAGMQVI